MAHRRIGIEIDHGRVAVAHVSDGRVQSFATYFGDDALDALRSALETERLDAPVRASLSAHGTALRRIEVTADNVASRASLEQAAFEAFTADPDSVEVAGLLPDPSEVTSGAVAPATVAVAAAEATDAVYRLLTERRGDTIEVVPSPFALVGRDGLHLSVGHGEAELTLVVDHVPVAFRQLRASGLVRPASGLDRASGGWDRLFAVMAGGSDPIAGAEFTRWCGEVAAEVASTATFWGRDNTFEVPDSVWVTGPAAPTAPLRDALSSSGFTPYLRDEVERAMAEVPLAVRPSVTGAYLAAVTVGVGSPAAAFPNPVLISRARARRARRSTLRIAAGVAAACAVVAVAGLGPLLLGRAELASARADRAAAAAELAAVATADADVRDRRTRTAIIRSAGTDPRFAVVVDELVSSAPPGTEFSQLNVAADGETLDVSVVAKMPPGDYGQVTAWLDRLSDDLDAADLWTSGFSRADDGVTVSTTFSLDAGRYPLERDNGGAS